VSFAQPEGGKDLRKVLKRIRCFPDLKDADPGLPEVENARKGLAGLKGS